jgi:hypothetical protein
MTNQAELWRSCPGAFGRFLNAIQQIQRECFEEFDRISLRGQGLAHARRQACFFVDVQFRGLREGLDLSGDPLIQRVSAIRHVLYVVIISGRQCAVNLRNYQVRELVDFGRVKELSEQVSQPSVFRCRLALKPSRD